MVLIHYETKPDLNKLDINKRNFKCNKSWFARYQSHTNY